MSMLYRGKSVRVQSREIPMRRREKGNEVDNLEGRRQREGGLRVMAMIVGLSVLQGQWLGMMLETMV